MCCFRTKQLWNCTLTKVVYKTEYEAKSRARSKKQVKNHEKLNYIIGGTQEKKINFVKIFFPLYINWGAQE